MSNDRNDISSATATKNLTSWWMMRLESFNGLAIHPSQIIGYARRGEAVTWPCEPEFATCWIVYGLYRLRDTAGGHENFASFSTKADAQIFHDRLIKMFPHLRGPRPVLR